MRYLVLLALFVLGAVAGMAATPLLSDGARQQVADFQQEVRYTTGREVRPTVAGDVAPMTTPTRRPTATPRPTSTPRPTPTPTPRAGISDEDLDSLRYLALRLINRDRADHGLPPVVIGTNPAAQLHAEDMLAHDYFGHWWADGRKPYMVYSQTGGTSYAGENAATSGWTDREWNAQSCGSRLVRCIAPDLAESITDHQQSMMYDDAHADWGHRDNILGESHRAVNIGVASNGRRVTFVQHFEGGAVEADGPPVLNANGVLSLSLAKRETGVVIGRVVGIYYDSPPTPTHLRRSTRSAATALEEGLRPVAGILSHVSLSRLARGATTPTSTLTRSSPIAGTRQPTLSASPPMLGVSCRGPACTRSSSGATARADGSPRRS